MAKSTNHTRYKAAALATVVLWASAFIAIRYSVQFYHPNVVALLRYLMASLCMLVVYFFYPNKIKPSVLEFGAMMGLGVFGVAIYNVTLNLGEQTVPAALAGFIVGQTPVLVAVCAALFFRERMRVWGIIGFLISLFGLVLIVLAEKHKHGYDPGLTYLFIALLANSIFVILQKPLLKKFHPIEMVSFAIWGGTIVLLFFGHGFFTELHTAPFTATLAVLYMGIFPGALAYLLWAYAFTGLPATRASSFIYLIPFVTLIFGWVFLDEIPPKVALLGGLIAISGAYLIGKNTYKV